MAQHPHQGHLPPDWPPDQSPIPSAPPAPPVPPVPPLAASAGARAGAAGFSVHAVSSSSRAANQPPLPPQQQQQQPHSAHSYFPYDLESAPTAASSPALRSHSSSFEADDERSATAGPQSTHSTTDSNANSITNSVNNLGEPLEPFGLPLQIRIAAFDALGDRQSDTSSDYHPGQPFRPIGAMPAALAEGSNGFSGDDDDDHPRRPYHGGLRHRRGRRDPPDLAYAGEDTRPTSKKEILGWYMYAFASETYVICAIASFIPILLESLARENGVLLSDHTTPCKASNARSMPSAASALLTRDKASDSQCIIFFLGIEINTASFAMYTFSISVLLQALLVVSISCAADHGNYRKTLLLIFAWTGSIAVMLFLVVSARIYLLGSLLAIISNTSFGASFVLLNSFLPLLVRHHPSLLFGFDDGLSRSRGTSEEQSREIQLRDDGDEGDHHEDATATRLEDSTTALLPPPHAASPPPASDPSLQAYAPARISHEEQTSLELAISTQISSTGIGIGYCAALFVQCIAILIVFRMHNTLWSQRIVLFAIGAWWGIFTIPAALWLRPRPGPPLPPAAAAASPEGGSRFGIVGWARSWAAYLAYAWTSLFRTIGLARRLVDIVLFLAGWFLLSDAIATTSSTAVLFAKTQLHMEVWALGLINVISTCMGVVGAFSWAFVSRRLGLRPLHTILACLVLFELIPLYGLAGYLPFVRRWGVGGLQQPWEMYPLAAVYGLVLGGLSSYCRSLYGELIPPGSEAAFYALYAITDKGSSVFGPAIVGAIIDASGEIRPAFWFLAALVGVPAPLLYCVNVERGKREGERLATFIEGFRSAPASSSSGLGESEGGGGAYTAYATYDETSDGSSHTPRAILGDYDDDEEVSGRAR